jgi:hypothetical protein
MKIHLQFKNIVDEPRCRITINNQVLFAGITQPQYTFDVTVPNDACRLSIVHWDKLPKHTIVEHGVIVRDRSFELERCVIDGYDLQELVWHSQFVADNGAVYKSCLFFGPNGEFQLDFENPALRWILRTRHEKNNNDPHWEQDFEYYQQACNRLKLMSIK